MMMVMLVLGLSCLVREMGARRLPADADEIGLALDAEPHEGDAPVGGVCCVGVRFGVAEYEPE